MRIKVTNNYIFSEIIPSNVTLFRISQKFINNNPPSYRTGNIALAQWNYFDKNANQNPYVIPQIAFSQLLEWKQDNELFIFAIPTNDVFFKPRLAIIADNKYLRNDDYWILDIDYWLPENKPNNPSLPPTEGNLELPLLTILPLL